MKAMILDSAGTPLKPIDWPDPMPGVGEIRLKVEACAVCRTDLHVVDGDLRHPKLPLVPGHEIVGIIDLVGEGVVANLTRRDAEEFFPIVKRAQVRTHTKVYPLEQANQALDDLSTGD